MAERLVLKPRASLTDYQAYVEVAMEKNGRPLTVTETQLLVAENLGLISKAIRVDIGLAADPKSKIPQKEEALAGLFFFTILLANQMGIDLEPAFLKREQKYKRRNSRTG